MDKHFTIGDLKKKIADLSDDMIVGKVGHFGEARCMGGYDFQVKDCYIVTNGVGWMSNKRVDIKIFEINSPDIGPDPE